MQHDETETPPRPSTQRPKATVLLLADESTRESLTGRGMFADADAHVYDVVHISAATEPLAALAFHVVDVVVLELPSADGSVGLVQTIKEHVGQIPIVVLHDGENDEVALACIRAGAHDCLPKSTLRPDDLRRAVGYAIARAREAHVRDLHVSLQGFRSLASRNVGTSVTAALVGSGAIALRSPATYEGIVAAYDALIDTYLSYIEKRSEKPRALMERLATMLGDANGGPRDLLDVHLDALDRSLRRLDDRRSRMLVYEARLLALEMMGLMVDYYRVGFRRLFSDAFAL